MKQKKIVLLFLSLLILGIAQGNGQVQSLKTIASLLPPLGFDVSQFPNNTFSSFVQHLPLKSNDSIRFFDRRVFGKNDLAASYGYNVLAVVALPLLFTSDLEQCADFSMRIWAEYFKTNDNLQNFYLFDYNGNRKLFRESGMTYTAFLKKAFMNTNSYSLKRGCMAVADSLAMPGDMFIQNERGGIGHVSMIVSSCHNAQGEKLFLIGYSFMPAQEFHIEKADDRYGKGGWFTLTGYCQYLKDNLDLGTPSLKRFKPL